MTARKIYDELRRALVGSFVACVLRRITRINNVKIFLKLDRIRKMENFELSREINYFKSISNKEFSRTGNHLKYSSDLQKYTSFQILTSFRPIG